MQPSILITGADRGLGLSLTKHFLSLDFRVFAGCFQPSRLLDQLKLSTQSLTILPLDITDADSIQAALNVVALETDCLDILLNNAGIHLETHRPPLESTDLEVVRRTFEVNAMGPLRMTKAFFPLLSRGGRKIIANISSEAGSIADCWRKSEYGYSMSKAALNMQTRILHNDLSPQDFTVLAVHPGWMRTEMGGMDADIDAAESAAGIAALILKENPAEAGIYLDYLGSPLQW